MTDDPDPEVQVGAQAPHDGQLLVVLLPEHGNVRPGRCEQLGDHRCDAVEVPGP
jgi:hypothetical protein